MIKPRIQLERMLARAIPRRSDTRLTGRADRIACRTKQYHSLSEALSANVAYPPGAADLNVRWRAVSPRRGDSGRKATEARDRSQPLKRRFSVRFAAYERAWSIRLIPSLKRWRSVSSNRRNSIASIRAFCLRHETTHSTPRDEIDIVR